MNAFDKRDEKTSVIRTGGPEIPDRSGGGNGGFDGGLRRSPSPPHPGAASDRNGHEKGTRVYVARRTRVHTRCTWCGTESSRVRPSSDGRTRAETDEVFAKYSRLVTAAEAAATAGCPMETYPFRTSASAAGGQLSGRFASRRQARRPLVAIARRRARTTR